MVEYIKIFDELGNWNKLMFEWFEVLVKDYCYLVDFYQQGIEISDDEKDFFIQDIFIGFKIVIEKWFWMI